MHAPSLQSTLNWNVPGALDEERPPLLEERLERVEVDDRGIGFDLTEVGIHRRGQREARAQRVLQVESHRARRIGTLVRAGCRSPGLSDRLPTVYGSSSSFFGEPPILSPRTSANCETKPLALRDSSGQDDVSASRPISRITAKPTGPPSVLLKRSCENGMRNSAVQPSGVARDFHVPDRVPAVVTRAVVEVVAIGLDARPD